MRLDARWSRRVEAALLMVSLSACSDGDPSRPPAPSDADALGDVVDAAGDSSLDAEADGVEPVDPSVRTTEAGRVRGAQKGDAWAFLGVPYAQPPMGERRFRPAGPPEAWDGIRDAVAYGPACRQYYYDGRLIGDEDCLTLNVWTPVTPAAAPLPVMVFVHGGDNLFGFSGEYDFYDGRHLAGQAGVVLVTINYRLGAFGFLADPAFAAENPAAATGNYGLHDQIAALEWVQANIANFGGDPRRVMLFGQSAGASNTCALLTSPLASGLFQRALMQSLNCEPIDDAIVMSTWRQARANLGCTGAADVAACLREAPADQVAALSGQTNGVAKYYVNVDGAVLVEDPLEAIRAGRHNRMPVVLGTTVDEYSVIVDELVAIPYPTVDEYPEVLAGIFGDALTPELEELYPVERFPSPRRAVIEVISDYLMHCPTRRVARALRSGQTEPTWLYAFAHDYASGPLAEAGAAHGFENTFIFRSFSFEGITPSADEVRLSDAMIAGWTGLAREGAPAAPSGFEWARYDDTERETRLDWPLSVEDYPRNRRCDRWDAWL